MRKRSEIVKTEAISDKRIKEGRRNIDGTSIMIEGKSKVTKREISALIVC